LGQDVVSQSFIPYFISHTHASLNNITWFFSGANGAKIAPLLLALEGKPRLNGLAQMGQELRHYCLCWPIELL